MNKNILVTGVTVNLGKTVANRFIGDQNQVIALIPPFEDEKLTDIDTSHS